MWAEPFALSVALVYLHPLMALWLLDRELRRSHPAWRPAYHVCLLAVPLLLVALMSEFDDIYAQTEPDAAVTPAGYSRSGRHPQQTRSVTIAKHGIVATSHPLASREGGRTPPPRR